METVKINLNSLPPEVSKGLESKMDLDASNLDTLSDWQSHTGNDQPAGFETPGVKVEETSFLDTSKDTFGLPIIETSNELFSLGNLDETFGHSGEIFSLDHFKDTTASEATEEVADPTFVTHAFNQKLNLSRKKDKIKDQEKNSNEE